MKICVSIAEFPGTFGVTFHNQFYSQFGLDYVYIPLKVVTSQLESVMSLMRYNFHGCSVSMPHKTRVLRYLDKIEGDAVRIEAVNTILNRNGFLIGYNTDVHGARRAIEEVMPIREKSVFMLGAGGVARAIGLAVKDLGGKLTISNRTDSKAKELSKLLGCNSVPYQDRDKVTSDLFINATSVGMNKDETPVPKEQLNRFGMVMDCVVNPTRLIKDAESLKIKVIPGRTISIYQAVEQFRIYTGVEISEFSLDSFMFP